MKKIIFALMAALLAPSLYAVEANRTIEFPKGVRCRFEEQKVGWSRTTNGRETMDVYVCGGKDLGILSIVYYEKLENDDATFLRSREKIKASVGDSVQTNGETIIVFNESKHLIRGYRYEADKRIEYISLVKTWNGEVERTLFTVMEDLQVPSSPFKNK